MDPCTRAELPYSPLWPSGYRLRLALSFVQSSYSFLKSSLVQAYSHYEASQVVQAAQSAHEISKRL